MKKIFSLGMLIFLVACASQLPPLSTETIPVNVTTSSRRSPAPFETNVQSPTKASSTTRVTQTLPSTPTPVRCLQLLRPESGTNLSASGHVTFEWEKHPDAKFYVLTLTLPNDARETYRTEDTRLIRLVKTVSKPSSYTWNVTAYDSESQIICTSGKFTFSRLSGKSTATTTRTFIVPPTCTCTASVSPSPKPNATRTFIVPPTVAFTPTQEPPYP